MAQLAEEASDEELRAAIRLLGHEAAEEEEGPKLPRGVVTFGGPPKKRVAVRTMAGTLSMASNVEFTTIHDNEEPNITSAFLWSVDKRLLDSVVKEQAIALF